eukprot:gene3709-3972_t
MQKVDWQILFINSQLRCAAYACDVFVCDFDGVLVDSEPEVSASAYAAAQDYWPDLFAGVTEPHRQQVMAGLRQSRPVLVRGYESMVMARMLLEDPSCVEAILADWHPLLEQTLSSWGENWQELQESFEKHRAGWLGTDRAGWLAKNQPYPGVVDVLKSCEYPVYFASSKAAHRVATLMQEHFGMADITEQSPRLFASLLPPEEKKVQALRTIAERPICTGTGTRKHFIDDRLDTLTAVQEAADLRDWNLYLADWGYNTAAERQAARGMTGIRVLSRPAFIELLKWGIVMGVDDGCEPTAEEVAAALAFKGQALYGIGRWLSADDFSKLEEWGWSATGNPCEEDWQGVACNHRGNVIAVNVANKGLTGSLPPVPELWAGLKALKYFNLAGNSLTGPLPPAITAAGPQLVQM